jgi:hypothetical protein
LCCNLCLVNLKGNMVIYFGYNCSNHGQKVSWTNCVFRKWHKLIFMKGAIIMGLLKLGEFKLNGLCSAVMNNGGESTMNWKCS